VSALPLGQSKSAWAPSFWAGFAACAVVLVVGVPILNLLVPANSAVAIPDYLVPLLGKYLCYALLALSLDLIWGYGGY
jgi:urea transport system permease protein